jgi:predicted HAD superfamily Cof-like phosphohydrolase
MSIRDAVIDVIEFHKAFDVPVRTVPAAPSFPEQNLRWNLLDEEMDEVGQAWIEGDIPGFAKELCDLIYIAIGTALVYGIPLEHVWDEVHKSNMAKAGGPRREDGKILKPEGWAPPDVRACLIKYGYTD